MAQTKRKRQRKHRGTQGGSVNRRSSGRPRTKEEARAQARRQAGQKREKAPSWQGAITRALIMSALLFVLMALVVGEPIGSSAALATAMLVVYVPAGYYLERFLYNRRRAAAQREREEQRQLRNRR